MNRILATTLRSAAAFSARELGSLACVLAINLTAICLLGMVGCKPSAPANTNTRQVANAPPEGAQAETVDEFWEICQMQGKRIGYGHTTVRRRTESGHVLLCTEKVARMSVNRGGQSAGFEMRATSVETPQGELIRFDSELSMGPVPIRTTGRVQGGRLDMEISGPAAKPARTAIAWSPEYGGPFALEQSLTRRPMRPGERRTLQAVEVTFNQVVQISLEAKDFEPVTLRNGTRDLLRIETRTQLPGAAAKHVKDIRTTAWCDRAGNMLLAKADMQPEPLETVRASRAEALEKVEAAELDLFRTMMVKVDRPILDAHATKQVRYRVRLKSKDPSAVFSAGPTQAVKSLDAHTAEITVYAIRPGEIAGNAQAAADPPAEGDLRPNNYIQSDDPLIVADARKAAGDEKDPWRVAVALERFVNQEVANKDFSHALVTAAEAAKSREGDCKAHAFLLAALARARGIPARVAMGLVYLERQQAFLYHMWTELYVGNRWIPLDATLARGGIGAAHIKIAESNMAGPAAISDFVPVAEVAGQLQIDVLDVKP